MMPAWAERSWIKNCLLEQRHRSIEIDLFASFKIRRLQDGLLWGRGRAWMFR